MEHVGQQRKRQKRGIMYCPLTLFIGLRYVFGKNKDNFGRFVSWLSMLGLMLGSMALIIVLSVMNGLERQMQTSILQFLPQAVVTSDTERLNPKLYDKTALSGLHGVDGITPLVTGSVILQSPKSIAVSQIMGITPNSQDPIKSFISFGQLTSLIPGKYHIIMSSALADQLQLKLGNKVRLIATNVSKITLLGNMPSQRIFTVMGFFTVNRDIDQSLLFINIKDAAKLFSYSNSEISGWRLTLTDPLLIDRLVHQPLPPGLHIDDWRADRGELFAAVKLEKKMMGLLISLIIIVAAFNIVTSLSLLVMEKQSEIAILKTQGLTNHRLMMIFIIQGAAAGIVGTFTGSLMGILIVLNLNQIMAYLHLSVIGMVLPTLIDPVQVTIIVIALVAISLLVTIYPSFRAAKTPPAEALRYE